MKTILILIPLLLSGCEMTSEEAYAYTAKREASAEKYWLKREAKLHNLSHTNQ